MKTSEFRRGNIVEWNRKPFVISRIFDDSVENELWCKPIDEIHPIPLTEEILLKCGFERNMPEDTFIIYNSFEFDIKSVNGINGQIQLFVFNYGGIGALSDSLCHIKYLHQLQNLYFTLVGIELEIEL